MADWLGCNNIFNIFQVILRLYGHNLQYKFIVSIKRQVDYLKSSPTLADLLSRMIDSHTLMILSTVFHSKKLNTQQKAQSF